MNVKGALIVLMIAMLMVNVADSWRKRRKSNKKKKPVVVIIVIRKQKTTSTGTVIRNKREVGVLPVPPCRTLAFFDLNDDGEMSAEEFAERLGETDLSVDLQEAFDKADTNHDGVLTEQELFSSLCIVLEEDDGPDNKETVPSTSPPLPAQKS